MKYYDPATKKRPEFESTWIQIRDIGIDRITGKNYTKCACGEWVVQQKVVFEHWQQGHFDIYEEYKEKEIK